MACDMVRAILFRMQPVRCMHAAAAYMRIHVHAYILYDV